MKLDLCFKHGYQTVLLLIMCGVEKYRFIVIDVVIACHSASLLIVMSAKSYKDLD